MGTAVRVVRAVTFFTYDSLPLGTTDASVIAVTERLKLTEVVTLDRRHVTIIRPSHVNALMLLP
jgi:predicted nucleic acid-binding protein